ncbi:MAG: ABC transporter ATP-binding protein [Candidatus Aminicenantes bacterium]|nr:ABC transporter ATP-binding protein [Candidatus Aminicenantes bacterium]
MLELSGVTKKFSIFPVVKGVSFTVKPGEILGYLGPNGAGKTTTIKMLAGLLEPTEGEILLDGKNIKKDMTAYKARVGYVSEQSEIYPHLSAQEYLLMVGRLRRLPDAPLREKIEILMTLFSLDKDMLSPISSYSKGMRQKVLISAALLHDPDILLLDEPLSGLDVTTGMVVRDVVQLLARDRKMVLYSSHVLEVTEKICSRVIILHHGRIVANDSVENLRNLMRVPSLEKVFGELVVEEDTAAIARRIVDTIKTN